MTPAQAAQLDALTKDMAAVKAAVSGVPDEVWRRIIPLRTPRPDGVTAKEHQRQAAEVLGWAHAEAAQANDEAQAANAKLASS